MTNYNKDNYNTSNEVTKVEMIWGTPILDNGFTTIPNMIIRNYRKLGMTHGEFGLFCQIVSHKHDARDAFPSEKTLAEYMESTERQIRHFIAGLEKKELVLVGQRVNEQGKFLSNVYNFKPLIDKALELIGESKLPDSKPVETIRYKTKKPSEEKLPTVPEEKLPPVSEEKLPPAPEEKLPTKRTNLKDKSKKQFNINREDIKTDNEHIAASIMKLKDRLTEQHLTVINEFLEIGILNDIAPTIFITKIKAALKGSKKSFKGYLETTFTNLLKDMKNAQNEAKKTVREEMLPEWLKKQQEEARAAAEQVAAGNETSLEEIQAIINGYKQQ